MRCLKAVSLAALLVPVRAAWGGQASTFAAAASERLLQEGGQEIPLLWLSLAGCEPGPVEGSCQRLPDLVIQLENVDPNGYVIQARWGDTEITCPAPACAVELLQTSTAGAELTFWAESPSDERKVTYTANVRVLPTDGTPEDSSPAWFVQVLSTQWRGGPVDACALAWDTFPRMGPHPAWLASPQEANDIASEVMYHVLASKLISAGAADVSSCPDGGLTQDGALSACGAESLELDVLEWQNQFDDAILEAGVRLGISATLMKAVIAQESQFWPGSIAERGEFGLGHLTEAGADNTLLWNKPFYEAFCPMVLGEAYCGSGYSSQSEYRRAMLRGALIGRIDADCADCEYGVDLDVAQESVSILAESLWAYCSQTGRMVANVTGDAPGRSSSYEDMWKLTLAAYSSGPGCLATALRAAGRWAETLSWEVVSREIPDECSGAIDYVEQITR